MLDLQKYMSDNLHSLVATAYKSVLDNPREARFALQMQIALSRGERRRKRVKEREGIDVPPFLICSIATTCNLQCKGCYARANGIASETSSKKVLQADDWKKLFNEASSLGFNVALLAGGEPLTRRDVIEAVATVKDMIFPVFTNGTLIGAQYIDFFRRHPNIIPVVSLEGDAQSTDSRRGNGVYRRAMQSIDLMSGQGIFFGVSITVTTANKDEVTKPSYLQQLHDMGCKLVFYVEYVPVTPETEYLAFGDAEVEWMERTVEERRNTYKDMLFVSFPGDEKLLDGCMAAGRGFMHIGPDGAAEPCPFSPQSDTNAAHDGLLAALRSPFFARLRAARALGWEHTGGCTLHEHKDDVEQLFKTEN